MKHRMLFPFTYLARPRPFNWAVWGFLCWISLGNLSAQYVVLEEIRLFGNKKTKDWVILQEMDIAVGDTLPKAQLERIIELNRRQVFNLNIFKEVEMMSVPVDSQHFSLLVVLKERFPLGGTVILGIQERNSYDILAALQRTDFHRLVFGERTIWRNITGRNEWLYWDFQWGFSRRVQARLVVPSVFRSSQVDMEFGATYIYQPEIIIGTSNGQVQWEFVADGPLQQRFQGMIGGRKRLGVFRSIQASLSYDAYVLADSLYNFSIEGRPSNYITNQQGKESYFSLRLGYVVDRRDWRSFPQEGYKWQALTRFVGGPNSTTQFAKVGLSWAHHKPFGKRWNISHGLQSVYTFGERLPFYEKSQVGITRGDFPSLSNELRGYQPYVIHGTWLNLAKAELKFAVFPYQVVEFPWMPIKSYRRVPMGYYLTAFVDMGYISDQSLGNADSLFTDRLLRGYGLGLNLIGIYDMLLRIEWARNHLGQSGIYFHGTLPIK